jgi:hypothetical protein
MRGTLFLSALIAAIPLSLAFVFNDGNEPRISMDSLNFLQKEKPTQQPVETGKILPILAEK